MLENAAIDVAIGLILMYLMLSLLCTVVNEYIATKLSLRSKSLASALEKLLDDGTLLTAFYNHGLIVGTKCTITTGTQSIAGAATDVANATGLTAAAGAAGRGVIAMADATGLTAVAGVAKRGVIAAMQSIGRSMAIAPAADAPPAQSAEEAAAAAARAKVVQDAKNEHPSYLSGNTVALALIGSLTYPKPPTAPETSTDPEPPIPVVSDIATAVKALPPSKIRDVLVSCLTEAGDNFGKLQSSIATWFDDAMDRLSGAYKRQIKWISMLVGLLVAIAFNADSFNVASTLWKDPDRRAAAVQMAESVAKQSIAAPGQQTPATGQPITDAQVKEQVEKTETSLRSLPIGWTCAVKQQTAASTTTPKPDMTWKDSAKQYWECAHKQKFSVLRILGWLLTAAAISLGAPFWFDLLNQFINLRGAGIKPQRADAGS